MKGARLIIAAAAVLFAAGCPAQPKHVENTGTSSDTAGKMREKAGETEKAAPVEKKTSKTVKLPEEPPYEVAVLSARVEESFFSEYSALQSKKDFSVFADENLIKMLAGEYNDYSKYLKKLVNKRPAKTGAKKLEIEYNGETGKISVKAENTPFNEVVNGIALKAGLSAFVHPDLNTPVSVTAENAGAVSVLTDAARLAGADIKETSGMFSFKPGKPYFLRQVPLPSSVTTGQCRMYYNSRDKNFYGEILAFDKNKTTAVHFIYVITKEKTLFNVKKLFVFATRLAGD